MQVTSPAPRDIWKQVLESDENALVSQSPEWIDSICDIGGYEDASRLYETNAGRSLVLPMVRSKRLPAAYSSQSSPPPSWGMGGLVAAGRIYPHEISAVFDELAAQPSIRTHIRPNPLSGEDYATAKLTGVIEIPKVAHVLDLTVGFGEIWAKGFKRSTRTKARKAEKLGVIVEKDNSGRLVPVFYELLLKSVDRWAKQQNEPLLLARWRAKQRDPIHKFEQLARRLGDAFNLWVAWYDGQPAAAILVLLGSNANYTRGAMDKDLAGPSLANYLLQKAAIEDACQAGCRFYHMGETGTSEALAHFKSRFGAVPYSYAEYRIERLPITRINGWSKNIVKKLINFKD
jgi:hypothetical protein